MPPFALVNRASTVTLDADRNAITQNGAKVQQWDYNHTPNQRWEQVDVGGGWFWLRNVESGKALDADSNVITQNGAKIQQWDYNGTPNQQWRLENAEVGWLWLRNRQSGKSLDVNCWEMAKNGAKVQQWDYWGGHNQQWRLDASPFTARFFVGPFDFDHTDMTADQAIRLYERHRVAAARISGCGNLNAAERQAVLATYQRAIRHSLSNDPTANASAFINGSQIWINFNNLFPQGDDEIAQTLIHEMMHCAGYSHPMRTSTDQPFDNGPYYSTPPLRAEICIAARQSDLFARLEAKAQAEECVEANGKFTIKS